MEHRNSTVCTSKGSLANNAKGVIGTVSHEFFHCWNIERIRPASLEPFNFDEPNISEALWFGEGFTNYFDRLTLARAGITNPEQFIKGMVGTFNYVLHNPGRQIRSAVQMSENAAFTDAGTSNDATNFENNFISYYSYGSVIALGLDLTLRSKYKTDLDEYMKEVWLRYGKNEIPYTMQDLETIISDLTNSEFARSFFKTQIFGNQLPDFKSLFAQFGIIVSLQSPESAYFKNPKLNKNGELLTTLYKGTALYDAGLSKGDKLISVAGREIDTTGDLNRVINTLKVGQAYKVEYEQLGIRKTSTFTALQDPRIRLSYIPDSKLKKNQIKNRKSWFNIE